MHDTHRIEPHINQFHTKIYRGDSHILQCKSANTGSHDHCFTVEEHYQGSFYEN